MDHGQQLGTTNADGGSLITRVFGVGFRRETYKNLAYLLARFPLGIVYFTVLGDGYNGTSLTHKTGTSVRCSTEGGQTRTGLQEGSW